MKQSILITGGSGFIGSHLLLKACARFRDRKIINVDFQTYAARPPLYKKQPYNLVNEKVDIRDQLQVRRLMEQYQPTDVVHLAAESHVCKSISGPKDFVMTNTVGTWNLLEEFKEIWKNETKGHRFMHVSTDEVFGQLGKTGSFNERSQMAPRSPYAASKASSDHLAQAYHETYGLDVVISNCSNNFGPNQHGEKLIPKTIQRIFRGKPVEVYGAGTQVRDWIFVEDHCDAILTLFDKGIPGQRYCVGGDMELSNMKIIETVYQMICNVFPKHGYVLKMEFANKRPTDDFRYALDISKVRKLGWKPNKKDFEKNLLHTITWYWSKMVSAGGRGPSVLKEE